MATTSPKQVFQQGERTGGTRQGGEKGESKPSCLGQATWKKRGVPLLFPFTVVLMM